MRVFVLASDRDRGLTVAEQLERSDESLVATVDATVDGAATGWLDVCEGNDDDDDDDDADDGDDGGDKRDHGDEITADCLLYTEARLAASAGSKLARTVESIRDRRPDLPIVCLGDGSLVDPEAALEAGVTDYVLGAVREEGLDRSREAVLARRLRNCGERYRSRRAAAEYRSLFERLPDAVVVHDANGHLIRANPEAAELLGYGCPEQLAEKRVTDIEVGLDSATLESVLCDLTPGETTTVDGRNRRADGTEFPVQVSVRRDETDDDRFVAVVRDVSALAKREQELERSLDLLEQTEVIADAGGWELDCLTGDLRWTEGTRRIYGVGDEYEPTLETVLDFYHPEDRPRIASAVHEAIADGSTFDETGRIVAADGSTRRIRARGEPRCEDGETVRLYGAVWDGTEQHRQRREIRASNAKLEALAAAFPDIALLIGEDGRYLEVYAGEESESLLVDSPDALVGGVLEELLPERQASTLRDAVDRAIESDAIQTVEYRLEVPAGERWFEGRVAPVDNRIDGSRAVVLVARDVTEHKETAAELRQREAHLEQAQALGNIGSWYKDLEEDRIYWSDEVDEIFAVDSDSEHSRYQKERTEGTIDHETFLQYIHPEDEAYVERKWNAAKRGEPYDIEHRIVTADGETKWVRQKAELTFDDGDPVSAVGVVQDVTERKAYERQLESQNERLEVFNRVIRHDLRNRLNVIEGYASMLERKSDDEGKSFARRIQVAAEELRSVGEELHRANSVVTGSAADRRAVELMDVLESAVASLRDRFSGFECSVSGPSASAPVRGAERLEIALEHVLENAIEHNDAAHPRIEVDASTTEGGVDDGIELTIADNGPGIPAAEREILTGQRERSQLEHASGLGLWIATWMVSSLDGEIDLENGTVGGNGDGEDDGSGTVVRLRLPRADPDAVSNGGAIPTTATGAPASSDGEPKEHEEDGPETSGSDDGDGDDDDPTASGPSPSSTPTDRSAGPSWDG
ncbi:light and oxygen sensing histidine kinase [Halobiforma nitratireducens JCM 10879]|uniref:histidine kinase n=1 Tax=Halobiforma nitratireducens JCM 10879 TaxID=1227454 RepID=M0M1G0_9EURY|nr:light and oxygen sensing histidine kinase [Halobiforma nitratireducens JCM 10879]